MKVYQIVEDFNKGYHAGSKATTDAVSIMSELGIAEVPVIISNQEQGFKDKIKRQISFFKDWKSVYKKIEQNSILILQTPFRIRQLGRFKVLKSLKENKQIKIVSLIHDVELLRYDNKKARKEFNEILLLTDQFIVHNESMKKWFVEQGVPKEKLVVLQIFDYLNQKSSEDPINFSRTVTIAGNLAKDKSPYVYKLGNIPKAKFELLGVNYTPDSNPSNVTYRGAFPPDNVPNELTHGFGLVWDGPSVETCAGETGEYLRFNNPHKLSLYLSSSLPVVIWSEAAEAEFVRKHKVGITVSSLNDLEIALSEVSERDYQEMVKNTKQIKEKLQQGYYLSTAVSEAINRINS